MKSKIIIATVSVVLLVLGVSVFMMGNHKMDHSGHKSGDKSQKKVSKYICPMHPQISSDKPGSCSICGMDLVPADQEEEHSDHDQEEHEDSQNAGSNQDHQTMESQKPENHAGFKLSLKKQQMIGVKIGKVQKKELFKSISAPGRIAFDPELYTAQSEYLEALKQWRRVRNSPISAVRENTNQMIKSSKIRLKVLGLSDDQIKDLAKKGSQSEGLLVSGKGQDNWIYADVFEVDLPYIKKGLSAKITANFLQGKTLSGEVISVDQVISTDTRTAKVRIKLLEKDTSIRPESYVNVTIFAPVGKHLSVPLEAIMDTGREAFIFVKKDKGKFEPRKVNIVLETNSEAALLGGVEPGEEVVVGANFMLDSESRLKSVIQGGDSSSGHNH